ncbi:MAG: hypothetical protein WCY92_05960 [Novosphingobium sp.]
MPRIISVPFIALTKKEHPLPSKPAPGSRANWLKKPNIVPANFPIPLGFFPEHCSKLVTLYIVRTGNNWNTINCFSVIFSRIKIVNQLT